MWRPSPSILVAITVLGACLAFYGRMLLPANTLAGMDFLNLEYPRGVLVQGSLRAGELPLWNPYEWSGAPLHATMQGSVLYPPMWLAILFPLPFGLQVYLFVHLLGAALGMATFSRYLTSCGPAVAAFAGISYIGGGHVLGHMEQTNVVATMAWIPWLYLTTLKVADGKAGWRLFVVSLVMAMLPGHPQTVVLAMLPLLLFVAIRLHSFTPAIRIGALAILAGPLLAAQLLPTAELASLSERVWPYIPNWSPSLPLVHLQGLLVPRYFNSLAQTPGKPVGFSELGLYLGTLTWMLAGLACILAIKRNRLALSLAVAACFCYLFATGPQAGIGAFLMKHLPVLSSSRGAARILNSGSIFMVLLAAQGLHALQKQVLNQKLRPIVGWGAAALVFLDLLITHGPERQLNYTRTALAEAARNAGPSDLRYIRTRLFRLMGNDSDFYLDNNPIAVSARVSRIQPNLNSMMRLRILDGYEEGLLPIRSYANLMRLYNRNLRSDAPDQLLLRYLGVGQILTEYPAQPDAALVSEWSAPKSPPLRLWRLPDETAILYYVPADEVRHLRAAFDSLALNTSTGATMRGQHIFQPTLRELTPHALHQIAAGQPLEIHQLSLNRFQVRVGNPVQGGSYFLAQSSYPGWKARSGEIDWPEGDRLALYGTLFPQPSSAMRAKDGVTEFSYQPFSFRVGLFVTLVSLLLLILAPLQSLLSKRLARRPYFNGG